MGMIFKDNILNEVYFGKTKEMLAIENQLDKFRNKYLGKYVFNTHVNSDPELLKFNRMIEDYFGFGCFACHIINQMLVNAFTAPIDYRIDVGGTTINNLIADKKTLYLYIKRIFWIYI